MVVRCIVVTMIFHWLKFGVILDNLLGIVDNPPNYIILNVRDVISVLICK